jgi:formylglycine-generating enzyme required for sulfatase activity
MKIRSSRMSVPRQQMPLLGAARAQCLLLMSVAWLCAACHHGSVAIADEVADSVKRVEQLLGTRFVQIAPGVLDKIPYPDPQDFEREADEFSRFGETYDLRIVDPYYVGVTEVTCAQWQAIMTTQPWAAAEDPPSQGNHPATVRFFEALEFCRAVSKKVGVKGARVRLPLEIEWEYACRASTRSHYFFGNDARRLDEFAWHQGNANGMKYHPVGTKKPNAWGLHDMHGSVWEWCADYWNPEYPRPEWYKELSMEDHTTPEFQKAPRIVRGGGPVGLPFYYRSDYRREWSTQSRTSLVGFRIVVSGSSDGHHQGLYVPE